jgi:Bax protein
MKRSSAEILVIPIAALFTLGILWLAWLSKPAPPPEPRPDFTAIDNVKEKKETFFKYMLPKVRRANDRVLSQREQMLPLLTDIERGEPLSRKDRQWLQSLATRYRVKEDPVTSESAREKLLKRVDTVPASLALAQAANESAWGTARFDDVDASVQYYMLTLNSHPAYQDLRNIRFDARNNDEPVRGVDLANGLLSYSERREAYVEEIQAMIRTNNLQRFSRRTQ